MRKKIEDSERKVREEKERRRKEIDDRKNMKEQEVKRQLNKGKKENDRIYGIIRKCSSKEHNDID